MFLIEHRRMCGRRDQGHAGRTLCVMWQWEGTIQSVFKQEISQKIWSLQNMKYYITIDNIIHARYPSVW